MANCSNVWPNVWWAVCTVSLAPLQYPVSNSILHCDYCCFVKFHGFRLAHTVMCGKMAPVWSWRGYLTISLVLIWDSFASLGGSALCSQLSETLTIWHKWSPWIDVNDPLVTLVSCAESFLSLFAWLSFHSAYYKECYSFNSIYGIRYQILHL